MKTRSKCSVLSLGAITALAVLWIVPVAGAGGDSPEAQRGTVSSGRGGHATISFDAETPVSIELHGRLIDGRTREPLRNAAIEVVRFEAENGSEVVTLEDVMALPATAKAVIRRTTESQGRFVLPDLVPGRYSLQVAWDDVPEGSEVVRWELRWIEKPIPGHADG